MFFKNRIDSLQDIRKILVYTPPIFIIFITIFLSFVTFLILEHKKENKLDLLLQEEKFEVKISLNNYIRDSKYAAHSKFDVMEKSLSKSVYELNGYLKSINKRKVDISEVKEFIECIQKEEHIQFVIFNYKTLEVLHGKDIIQYLQSLTTSSLESDEFTEHMVKNIYYVGDDSLQYWIDKKRKIRLSYFVKTKSDWFIGAFSKIDDIKYLIKESIEDSLVLKSKVQDNYFWLYDYDEEYIYNYFNKGQKLTIRYVLKKEKDPKYRKIIENYRDGGKEEFENIYNFKKFQYLVSTKLKENIENETVLDKVENIKKEYRSKLVDIVSLIFLSAFILIAITITFTKFVNRVFTKFNKRLRIKNELLKNWKNRYELAIIASNDGLWEINFSENRVYFSKKWLDMFGYDKSDITSLDEWFALIHVEDRARVKKKFNKHTRHNNSHFICEYRLKNKDNIYKWVLVRGKAFINEEGVHKMLMMSMDIDDRKNLRKELNDIELLVEVGRIVIFKWKNSKDFDVQYVSKSINSYGYNKKEFESSKLSYLDFVHPDDIGSLKDTVANAINRNLNSFSIVYRVIDKNRQIRWVFNRSILLKDHHGKVTHLYGYINDITQMKITEEELKKRVAQEVEKNIEKDRLLIHQNKLASMGEMLGSIAHQWRQPLNNINLLIHFVRDNYENKLFTKEDLHESIGSAKEQIDYMSRTIDDFRDFYKPTKSRVDFYLQESIKQAFKIVKTDFEKNNIKLIISNNDVKINGYENEFQQVIVNILSNAKHAAIQKSKIEKFSAVVEVNIIEEKNNVILSLSNNCGNVDKEVLERMFEPYFTTKFEDQGTGIGLYMSKTIIEKNMDGKITAKNLEEDSLEFTIKLPIN